MLYVYFICTVSKGAYEGFQISKGYGNKDKRSGEKSPLIRGDSAIAGTRENVWFRNVQVDEKCISERVVCLHTSVQIWLVSCHSSELLNYRFT